MGFDNPLISIIRDGQREGMAITILGSSRPLHITDKSRPYIRIQESSQQTERDGMMNREAATRDPERERARRRYSRDLDVRYMSSLRNLKDRLLSGYSCNQRQCPMIRERLLHHHQSVHGARSCEKKCNLASSKSKNCVSIRAGPDVDQYSDQKCDECPRTSTDFGNYSSVNLSKYHGACAKPVKGNLKNERKYSECCTTPSNTTLRIRNDYASDRSHCEDYVDSSAIKAYSKTNRTDDSNNCRGLQITECNGNSTFSGRYTDGCSTPNEFMNNRHESRYCEPESTRAENCSEYAASYGYAYSNANDPNTCARSTRYVEGGTSPSNCNFSNNRTYTDTSCDANREPACKDNYATYSSSFIGNIEAPKYPIVRASQNHDEECQPSTSKGTPHTCKIDNVTNTPTMVDNGTDGCENVKVPCKKLFTVDECIGNDSIMSSIISIVKSRSSIKNKASKVKRPPNKCAVDTTTSNSYKLIPPYAVDKSSSKSDNKLVPKSNGTKNKRSSTTNPIYREVKDWIHEVPVYPGLTKEDKDKNTVIIHDLVKKLNKISTDPGSSNNAEKIRHEIEECLSKIPLWYPGAPREQIGFKRNLIDRLVQRLQKVNAGRKSISADNSKRKLTRNGVTEVHTSLTPCNQSFQLTTESKNIDIKICIIDWLQLIYSMTNNNSILKNQMFLLADLVAFRVKSLMDKPIFTSNDNLILKTAILNIMHELPIVIDCPISKDLHLQDLAGDLANKLFCIQAKYSCEYSSFSIASESSTKRKDTSIYGELKKCFEEARIDCNNMVLQEVGSILHNCSEICDSATKRYARNKIMNLLVTSTNLSETQAWNLSKIIIKRSRTLYGDEEASISSQTYSQLLQPFSASVYSSIDGINPLTYPVTSAPKKTRGNQEIPKLNSQEIEYMKNVSNLIRDWMKTLPESFSAPDEEEFKETMIHDLAGDIMDEAKLEQLAPNPTKDKREIRKYIVCRWIFKLNAFKIPDVDENVETFLNALQEIPVPIMTQPQQGNRQAMENIKYNEDAKWTDNFVPKSTDILEDEISIWMHEQPSDIFIDSDQKLRQDKIHELAHVLGNTSGEKPSPKEVSKDIRNWLNQIVRPENQREISELTENLRDRVISLPQDKTLADIVENRKKIREELREAKIMQKNNAQKIYVNENKDSSVEVDNTMVAFISKFIERHYDVADPLARRAFNRLLNNHLQSLNPLTRKEVYDNFENNEQDERFPANKVIRELEYIKDISDWLKNLPIDPLYNSVGNRDRVDFVNSLALSIREVEEDRENNPDAMDYDIYMSGIILQHLKLLSIPQEYHENCPFMIAQLINKIISHRRVVTNAIEINESMNTTAVNPDNIGDFIEEFIRINGNDIAHDEVKMEAWAIRLIREIKKIVPSTSSPSALSKANVYNKLSGIPIPSEETVEFFNLELNYVKEITDWVKNLPLLPMNDSQTDDLTNRICNLAEKIVDMERKKLANPNDKQIDPDFKEYLTKWILELPLNTKQKIVSPILISQLINRMEKLKQSSILPESSLEPEFENITHNNDKNKKSKSSIFNLRKKKSHSQTHASNLTDAVEKWSHALPIRADSDNATSSLKDDVSRRIFQEVGQLNTNPTINNDDILYKDKLTDGINNILENVPQNNELENKKVKLRDDIINTIIEIRNDIKEKTAGNTYRLQLEKTIDTSIPDPVPCNQVYDPGFEIYKSRLATAFILDNFDYGADLVKVKYETLLRKEIDKYFSHANNRNAIPLSKDQLCNELYSALFKVAIPKEISVIGEVEKIKTRCEIDAWFEELPMREANGLSELLDWDKILSTITTRIHEIETSESKPDSKIFKEIMKWLVMLPMKPGNEKKLEEFATNLQKRLKSTSEQRKCVLDNTKGKSKKDKAKSKVKVSALKNKENQAARLSNSKIEATLLQRQDVTEHRKQKNAADEIYDIVRSWCNQLPINSNEQEHAQTLKDDLTTKIIIKISELNANPDIFCDDGYYDGILREEIEKLISNVSTSFDFNDNKAVRIQQLVNSINTVKPHIEDDRVGHKYKTELTKIVDKILIRPQTSCPGKKAYLDVVRNDIIDDFVQYKYSNDDDEVKQGYKINLKDNINKYTTSNTKSNTSVNKNDQKINSLVKTNQLITELAKVVPKTKIVSNEVEHIRMKKGIAAFLDEIGVPKKDIITINRLIERLANKLNDIEIAGYTPENENKMQQEILRCLKKLGKDQNPSVVDAFIVQLKNSENARRMPQQKSLEFNDHDCNSECPFRNEGLANQHTHKPALYMGNSVPVHYEKRSAYPAEENPRRYENKTDNKKTKSDLRCCPQDKTDTEILKNKDQKEVTSTEAERHNEEESYSDDEDSRICLCKRYYGSRHRRRPYCMVPMPMRYVYEGRDVLNSLWCGMPLPLF